MSRNCSLVPDSQGGASLSFDQDVLYLTATHVERSSVLQQLIASCTADADQMDLMYSKRSCQVVGLQQQSCLAWVDYLDSLAASDDGQMLQHFRAYQLHDFACHAEGAAAQSSRAVGDALLVRICLLYTSPSPRD